MDTGQACKDKMCDGQTRCTFGLSENLIRWLRAVFVKFGFSENFRKYFEMQHMDLGFPGDGDVQKQTKKIVWLRAVLVIFWIFRRFNFYDSAQC